MLGSGLLKDEVQLLLRRGHGPPSRAAVPARLVLHVRDIRGSHELLLLMYKVVVRRLPVPLFADSDREGFYSYSAVASKRKHSLLT